MNRFAFIPVIAVVALAGCTSEPGYILSRPSLNDSDRALLTATHASAEDAKSAAAAAAQQSKAARDAAEQAQATASKAATDAAKAAGDAAKANADAQTTNTKIDRMFQDEGK